MEIGKLKNQKTNKLNELNGLNEHNEFNGHNELNENEMKINKRGFKFIALMLIQAFTVVTFAGVPGSGLFKDDNNQASTLAPEVNVSHNHFQNIYYKLYVNCQTKDFWNEKVKSGLENERLADRRYVDMVLENAPLNPSKILTLGEGPFTIDIEPLLKAGHDVLATDLSDLAAEVLKRRREKLKLGSLKIEQLDYRKDFSLPDNEFDMVISRLAIGNYDSDDQLREILLRIKQVLKNDEKSRLIFQVKSVDDSSYGEDEQIAEDFFVKKDPVLKDLNHYSHFWREEKLTKILNQCGFKVVSIDKYDKRIYKPPFGIFSLITIVADRSSLPGDNTANTVAAKMEVNENSTLEKSMQERNNEFSSWIRDVLQFAENGRPLFARIKALSYLGRLEVIPEGLKALVFSVLEEAAKDNDKKIASAAGKSLDELSRRESLKEYLNELVRKNMEITSKKEILDFRRKEEKEPFVQCLDKFFKNSFRAELAGRSFDDDNAKGVLIAELNRAFPLSERLPEMNRLIGEKIESIRKKHFLLEEVMRILRKDKVDFKEENPIFTNMRIIEQAI